MTHRSMAALADSLAARMIATRRYSPPTWSAAPNARISRPWLTGLSVPPTLSPQTAPAVFPYCRWSVIRWAHDVASPSRRASPHVSGLVFFAFPLHQAGKPSDTRANHSSDVHIPMLFVQGIRDALASTQLIDPVLTRLADRATAAFAKDADHKVHVPACTGRRNPDVLTDLLDAAAAWMIKIGRC